MDFIKKYFNEILLSSIIILILGIYGGIGYFLYQKDSLVKEPIIEPIDNEVLSSEAITPLKMYVDVKGAVKNPGVYAITNETIINDVIVFAGGFNKNAYTKNINLSKKIADQSVIYVYTADEYTALKQEKEIVCEPCICPDVNIDNCTNIGSSVIENGKIEEDGSLDESNTSQDTEKELININTASKELLITLDGIGEAKAQNIIDYRSANGAFVIIEDIKKVSGISDNVYEKIKNNITV